MTTIKEYEAMMEGATDAVVFVCRTLGWLEIVPPYGDKVDRTKECDKAIIECGKISKAINANSEILKFNESLIRVIELAEDVLKIFADDEYYGLGIADVEKAKNALSEIRKLKGE